MPQLHKRADLYVKYIQKQMLHKHLFSSMLVTKPVTYSGKG